MKEELQKLAARLTEEDISSLIAIKKQAGKALARLKRKRMKIAESLAAVDAEIAGIEGKVDQEPTPKRRGRPPKTATTSTRTKKELNPKKRRGRPPTKKQKG